MEMSRASEHLYTERCGKQIIIEESLRDVKKKQQTMMALFEKSFSRVEEGNTPFTYHGTIFG